MSDLYVYTMFHNSKPRCAGIKIGDTVKIYDMYRPGASKPIATILQNITLIRDLLVKANQNGHRIITSDFKDYLKPFDLPLDSKPYNVYDLHYPDFPAGESLTKDSEVIKKVLLKMSTGRIRDYHKVLANAAIVYQDIQDRGLSNNYGKVVPIWSQKTRTGRSKTTGFNIHGFTDNNQILPYGVDHRSVLIHFDWISADIRAASLLSNDTVLQDTFVNSDPYAYMVDVINKESPTQITREECKELLLKSINRMDFSGIALSRIFRRLGSWIAESSKRIREPKGYLETLLHRRFNLVNSRNELAVLNGSMQGSVAHGMQNTIRKIWEIYNNRIVAEIHDSLVVASPPDKNEIKATINAVAPIMMYPFQGLLPENPAFPLKVSVGNKWRKWKLIATYRQHKVEYVKTRQIEKESPTSPESETETTATQEIAE